MEPEDIKNSKNPCMSRAKPEALDPGFQATLYRYQDEEKDMVLAQNQHVSQCRATEAMKQSQAYLAIRSLTKVIKVHTLEFA